MLYFDLNGDAFAEFFDVADDADASSPLFVEVVEGVDGVAQRFAAEGAEAFVDK